MRAPARESTQQSRDQFLSMGRGSWRGAGVGHWNQVQRGSADSAEAGSHPVRLRTT